MIADLDAWIAKLREKTPLEENELELLCRIVKDILMQEPNVIVFPLYLQLCDSLFQHQSVCAVTSMVSITI